LTKTTIGALHSLRAVSLDAFPRIDPMSMCWRLGKDQQQLYITREKEQVGFHGELEIVQDISFILVPLRSHYRDKDFAAAALGDKLCYPRWR